MKVLATITIPAQTVTLLDMFQQPQTHTIPAQPGVQQEIDIDDASADAFMARYGLNPTGPAAVETADTLAAKYPSSELFTAGLEAQKAGR